ncbi:MAG: hypothetical protein D6696_10060 [Acidobacteria bacterium]|nr:MAG: hypothetical protein D6696_10060 [Acidobacteriota bacterium]
MTRAAVTRRSSASCADGRGGAGEPSTGADAAGGQRVNPPSADAGAARFSGRRRHNPPQDEA